MIISEYIILVFGSVLFRFDVDFRSYIKEVGIELSDIKSRTGFQDAITPPKLNWLSFACYFIILGTIITAFIDRSTSSGFVAIFISLIVQVITGIIINPPGKSRIFKKFYFKTLYSSMVNRHADYKKENDNVRADAMFILIKKLEHSFPVNIQKKNSK
jgi:hypothetical protein